MATLMTMFQQLVSPEQKQLSEFVTTNGGADALRTNNRLLLDLEKIASKSSSTPSPEGRRLQRAKVGDVDDIQNEIFEDPGAAVEKNRDVFFRKFEVQKNQVIDEFTRLVQREGDRVIREIKAAPHERIRDRVGHLTLHSSTIHQFMSTIYLFFSLFTRSGQIW